MVDSIALEANIRSPKISNRPALRRLAVSVVLHRLCFYSDGFGIYPAGDSARSVAANRVVEFSRLRFQYRGLVVGFVCCHLLFQPVDRRNQGKIRPHRVVDFAGPVITAARGGRFFSAA